MSVMPRYGDQYLLEYARPPAQTTIDRVVAEHQAVRTLLGDTAYLTFLQGSYKNDTALWEVDDVDIVALYRDVRSTAYGYASTGSSITWDELFSRIERKLQSDYRYVGRWQRGDKCIRLNAGIKVDIVPAVYVTDVAYDPIAIYSFRALSERQNWPRLHYENGARKSGRTSGAFKQTVRLYKRFSKAWFGLVRVAPSYYIESLVHAQPDHFFSGDLAADFVNIASEIGRYRHGTTQLPRIAGDGNLLSAGEWAADNFARFQSVLASVVPSANAAMRAGNEPAARQSWRSVFNGQAPQ